MTGTRVRRILDGLPQRSRRILELRFLEAVSLKEAIEGLERGDLEILADERSRTV